VAVVFHYDPVVIVFTFYIAFIMLLICLSSIVFYRRMYCCRLANSIDVCKALKEIDIPVSVQTTQIAK